LIAGEEIEIEYEVDGWYYVSPKCLFFFNFFVCNIWMRILLRIFQAVLNP